MTDGGPAFPHEFKAQTATGIWSDRAPGMTLLDYFAGQAMQGVIMGPGCPGNAAEVSRIAYDFAQCMLAERERRMKEK
jgi:hypothetical protein